MAPLGFSNQRGDVKLAVPFLQRLVHRVSAVVHASWLELVLHPQSAIDIKGLRALIIQFIRYSAFLPNKYRPAYEVALVDTRERQELPRFVSEYLFQIEVAVGVIQAQIHYSLRIHMGQKVAL